MDEVETIALHRFDNELLVELIGVDEDGTVATETIAFDVVDTEIEAVTPREAVPTAHETEVWTALSEKRYSVGDR